MWWSAGWRGRGTAPRRPGDGRRVPGTDDMWTCGWPVDRVRAARAGNTALVVVGECGADDAQLTASLTDVRRRRWRELTAWPGSYLVVAVYGDVTAVIGDLAGQYPVYWRQADGGVWWASAASPLAAIDRALVDPVALAAHLACGQPDVLGERSLFREVHRVPTGHLLLLGPEGGARAVRYEPAEYPAVDMEEAAPLVRAALHLAVAARLDGTRPVSADLAGLDSTTLACLAAGRGPVTATTFADPRIRDDDLAYARRTATAVPGLAHHAVPGQPHTVFYDGLHDLASVPETDTPSAYTVTATINRAALAPVTGRPGVHFIGEAGDVVLSASSSYLADLWRTGPRRTAWQHTLAHARLQNTAPLALLRRIRPGARTTLAGSWRQCADQLRTAPRPWVPQADRSVVWTPLLACADWMAPDVRHHLADAMEHAADTAADTPRLLATWTDRQDLARIGADLSAYRALTRAEYDIELAAPYLDNEVVRACLAVPAPQRGTPGRYKPLLAAAFPNGPIPGFVLARTTKGGFNGLSYAGYRNNHTVLRDLLGPTSHLAGLGLITSPAVRDQLRRAAAGQPAAQGALHQAVSAEVWLRQQSTHTSRWWTEANTHAAA